MTGHKKKMTIFKNAEFPKKCDLSNVVFDDAFKWIFVGGKGGVGKTTCSSSIAVLLAKHRKSVLLISTDPAHNLSDIFGQKFSSSPTLVDSFDNLYAVEIDPESQCMNIIDESDDFMRTLMSTLPGVDEAMSYIYIVRLVDSYDFSVIVFDTAPTGHTIRLVNFPNVLESFINKLTELKQRIGPIFKELSLFMKFFNSSAFSILTIGKLEQLSKEIRLTNEKFKDPKHTTFICVCLPELLSLYETERLIQELLKLGIHVDNILVNQLIVDSVKHPNRNCNICGNKKSIQQKYLAQIVDLYRDFHVVGLPMIDKEIKGAKRIRSFSNYLMKSELYK